MNTNSPLKQEPVRRCSEFQRDWRRFIQPLRRGRYWVEDLESRSIHGDAPKNFIRIKEYIPGKLGKKLTNWPGYIAKVGSKDYPLESITEQLLTRIGQASGALVADSMLRMVEGQVRFFSKYFLLDNKESLVHGIQIFKKHINDDALVEEISIRRAEREFYSFQTVRSAMSDSFPEDHGRLMFGFVKMVGFDALVGNNDRHPLNWGVIVPVSNKRPPRFSPIYDTARALFWNVSETRIKRMVADAHNLTAYVNRSIPQIGWDGFNVRNHLDLARQVCSNFPEYKPCFEKYLAPDLLSSTVSAMSGVDSSIGA